MVVAEGELGHNGVFRVHALGFPPVEARAKSLAVAKARSAPESTDCGQKSVEGHAQKTKFLWDLGTRNRGCSAILA